MRNSLVVLVVLLVVAGGSGCSQYKDSVLYCCTDTASCPQIVVCDRDPNRTVCDQNGVTGPTNTCVGSLGGADAMQGCDGPEDCSGATPVCRTSDRTCVECLANTSCPTAEEPVCQTSTSTCGGCAADADCAGRGDGRVNCDTATGVCQICVDNADCSAASPICDAPTKVCRGCSADAECTASGVCNLETGTCVGASDVLYVDRVAGAGNMDCTNVAPCNSITKAVTAALGSRKWILVKADATSYMDSVDLSGTRAKEVVIKGAGATVDATPDDVPAFSLGTLAVVAANVRIEGLTIIGGFDSTDADGILCVGAGAVKPVLMLVGATVRNNTGSGIDATNCRVTVTGSTLSMNADGGIVATNGSTVTLTGSTVSGNPGGGVSLTSSDFTVVNNFFVENLNVSSDFGGVRLRDVSATQTARTLRFNTFFENEAQVGNPAGVTCTNVSVPVTFDSNLIWGKFSDRDEVTTDTDCAPSFSLLGPKVHTVGTNNVDINAAPAATRDNLFLSVVNPKNLHLKPGSKAINAASAAGALTTDFDGETRTKGAAADIGADEAE